MTVDPANEEPITEDPTPLARRVIELEATVRGLNATNQFWQAEHAARVVEMNNFASKRQLTDKDLQNEREISSRYRARLIDARNENARLERDNAEVSARVRQQARTVDRYQDEQRVLNRRIISLEAAAPQAAYTSAVDGLEARAAKLTAEAANATFNADTLPADQYWSRYRRAVEAQVLLRAVKELRAAVAPAGPVAAEVIEDGDTVRGIGSDSGLVREGVLLERRAGDDINRAIRSEDGRLRYVKADSLELVSKAKREPRVWTSAQDEEPPVGTRVVENNGTLWTRKENGWHLNVCQPDCTTADYPVWRRGNIGFPVTEILDGE